jgi:glycosyltransferase involved in cell wall biosynthesis
LRRLKRQIRPDAALLFGGPETFLARFLPGVPRIRFRGQDRDMVGPLDPWKNRLNMQPCAAVLVPARGLEERFRPIWPRLLRTVALGVDTHKFVFQADALAKPRRPTLRIVGRLDPIKGHAAFFAIFHHLLQRWPGGRPAPFLEVIGQPANISAEQLRAAALAAGLRESEDWALCTERVADIAARMSATDVGVIPSLGSEVICRVAEDFLVCGAPLFVSGVGALAESIVELGFGVSYRGLGVADSVQALQALLEKSMLETEGQRAARATAAVGYFSLERMGRELSLMLEELLTADPSD